MKALWRIFWRVSISLKFAVVVMLGLTLSMIVATVLESIYDTPTALYWVYQTWFFYGLLGLLGWLIFAVAISRLPWQKKHLPFLCAHLGILLLLYGSWVTYKFGVDGSLQVGEGKVESGIELGENLLLISDEGSVKSVPLPWQPPNSKFKPVDVPEYGLRVEEFISRAEPKVGFAPAADALDMAAPALRVKIAGGPSAPPFMRMGQETWIWRGDPNWRRQQVGPAIVGFSMIGEPTKFSGTGPEAYFRFDALDGKAAPTQIEVELQDSAGKRTKQVLKFADPQELIGKSIATGWKFDATITILEWIPRAVSDVKYSPARIQYGQGAPAPAIRLRAGPTAAIWLGLGERATLDLPAKDGKLRRATIGYFPRRVILPFGIRLEKFQIDRYQGTSNPSEFSSIVSVDVGNGAMADAGAPIPKDHLISMNEPMKFGGFTFYQASYLDAQPRPTVSVFSVNQDPGRWLKYLGSLLICLGSIWLFAVRYVKKKPYSAAQGSSE